MVVLADVNIADEILGCELLDAVGAEVSQPPMPQGDVCLECAGELGSVTDLLNVRLQSIQTSFCFSQCQGFSVFVEDTADTILENNLLALRGQPCNGDK